MRALIQRVGRASVCFPEGEPRSIGRGLLVFLGVGREDGEDEARRLADKILQMRIFPNDAGKFDRSLLDEKGDILVVSQFTLFADPWSGRRPDFTAAKAPHEARRLYESFVVFLRGSGLKVETGEFGAMMSIESVNDGPVTIWLDTDDA